MNTSKDSTRTTEGDEEEAARGGFLWDQDCLKRGKERNVDLQFIARQNAYIYEELTRLNSFPSLINIHDEIKQLRAAS